jgi:hypothetical protein
MTLIRDVLRSKLGEESAYFEEDFSGFSQSLQENARTEP